MINFVDILALRHKFGTFLSRLYYSACLPLDFISQRITFGEEFSFLENNNFKYLMNKQYNELAKEVFNVELKFDSNDVNPVYWAGVQYINIVIRKRIPLRQVFLLCPLKEMVAHFGIYHEMDEDALIDEFMNNEYKRSILLILRAKEGFSLSHLSKFSGLSYNTLKYYEKNNEKLFNASFTSLFMLKNCLSLDDYDFFRKETSFVPVSRSLFNKESFIERLKETIRDVYDINGDFVIKDRDYVNGDPGGLYIGAVNTLIYRGKKKFINDNEMMQMIKSSI